MHKMRIPYTFPEGFVFVDELNLPGENDRTKRELWCLWTGRDLLPMVLPKNETNTTLAELRKEL